MTTTSTAAAGTSASDLRNALAYRRALGQSPNSIPDLPAKIAAADREIRRIIDAQKAA